MQLNPKSTIVYFSQINRGSPGERAGIKKGDRLVEINEESVADISFDDVKEIVKLRSGSRFLPFLYNIRHCHPIPICQKNQFCDKCGKIPMKVIKELLSCYQTQKLTSTFKRSVIYLEQS